MMKLVLFFLFISLTSFAQVGIGTTSPDPSSILDITATDKGVLIPRMTTAQRDAITNPVNGLMVYNTDSDEIQLNSNSPSTPIWRALSLTSTGTAPGASVKYSNTDTTTDVNVTPAISLPVFGTQEWNDNATLYNVSGNQVTITETGRYEVIVNVSLINVGGNDRNAPEIRIALDGTEIGSYGSTGYIRSNNGHEESSLHIREVVEVAANQVLTVNIVRSANSNTVNLRSAGSSNIYIEKIM
ncbi:hypothetical protein POV27_15680 [Aureisphaera galaxeae]|uniref:hypothetical protein n=1 Tax=Aureisphaera galaxeae TaxID=1538023 RepID=UPI002350DE78|nr:hypothetical protein [Aureisphaera galaxeae]MDC8005498.1 hypothetical protein [Aureisphaera galaxeae]